MEELTQSIAGLLQLRTLGEGLINVLLPVADAAASVDAVSGRDVSGLLHVSGRGRNGNGREEGGEDGGDLGHVRLLVMLHAAYPQNLKLVVTV